MIQSISPPGANSTITTRFSFHQLLLLLSYVSLESSLPAAIGDTRQLEDIIRRSDEDWDPQVGLESFADMKGKTWQQLCWDTHRCWEQIHNYLAQYRFINSTISCDQLRNHLCYLLCGIEQISAQGLNATCLQLPNHLLGEQGSLALICISLSVIPIPGQMVPLRSLLVDSNQCLIKEMCILLQESPLFQARIWDYQIREALSSMEMFFSRGEENGLGCGSATDGPSWSQIRHVQAHRRETRILRYRHARMSFTRTASTKRSYARRQIPNVAGVCEVSEGSVVTGNTIVEESSSAM